MQWMYRQLSGGGNGETLGYSVSAEAVSDVKDASAAFVDDVIDYSFIDNDGNLDLATARAADRFGLNLSDLLSAMSDTGDLLAQNQMFSVEPDHDSLFAFEDAQSFAALRGAGSSAGGLMEWGLLQSGLFNRGDAGDFDGGLEQYAVRWSGADFDFGTADFL